MATIKTNKKSVGEGLAPPVSCTENKVLGIFCIKATKKIFFEVCIKDLNSNGKTVLDDVSLVY